MSNSTRQIGELIFFTLRMHIWNFHDIKGQKSISFKNENSKILQLLQVLCPPIDICSHWQGLFMIEGVFLYWPVFKLPRIAGIERGIFVTCDKWRYDTLKIMEMQAIYTQKKGIPSIHFKNSNLLWIAIKSKVIDTYTIDFKSWNRAEIH